MLQSISDINNVIAKVIIRLVKPLITSTSSMLVKCHRRICFRMYQAVVCLLLIRRSMLERHWVTKQSCSIPTFEWCLHHWRYLFKSFFIHVLGLEVSPCGGEMSKGRWDLDFPFLVPLNAKSETDHATSNALKWLLQWPGLSVSRY